MSDRDTSWGIEPVPERLRVLGGVDLALLWGNLGVSLLVVVAGAILVPALSLPDALVAILVGCLVGNLMLAVAGAIGAQARVPAMVLMRAPLGERGSYLPTVVNVVQCIGWTVFELLVIATAAAALSDELLGFEARWAWTLVFGAAALALGLLGPIGVVRTVIRRVAIWIVPLAVAYLAWWALTGGGLEDAWNRPGEGGLSTWQGIDIVVGVTVSWIPLAADYTRFARTGRGAFWGTGVGYFVPDALLLALGAVVLLTRDVADAASLPAAVAAGGIVALFALLALTVAETDEAFANAYSGAVSLQNLVPRAPQPLLIVLTTTLGTVGALVLELTSFQSFLFLLGSCFVPLFAVLLADWLAAGRRYEREDVFDAVPFRVGPIAGLGRRLRRLPVALADRAGVVGRPGRAARAARVGDRGDAAELRRVVRPRARARSATRRLSARYRARVSRIALVGNLAVDRVAGGPPRPGGGVYWAARAAAHVGADAVVVTRCAPADRDVALAPLEAFGFPVISVDAAETTAFSFHYEGDHRVMNVDAVGDDWSTSDLSGWAAPALADAEWVQVAGLLRSHFPTETVEALARDGRRLLLDAQGSLRRARDRPAPAGRRDRPLDVRAPGGPQAERGGGPGPRGRASRPSRCARWASARSSSRSARRARA